MPFKQISRKLKIYSKTASRLYNEAVRDGILFPPMVRPKICTDYIEYVYIINTKNTRLLFEKLQEDSRVEYMAWCQGTFDLIIITNERIDVTVEEEFKSLVLSGERGNYIYPDMKYGDYCSTLKEINEFLDKNLFQSSKLPVEIGTRGNEWSEREEKLFRYLKNNGRRIFVIIQERLDVSRTLLLACYSRMRKHTIITIPYYPKGYDQYTNFYLIVETEYEQQFVDLLGKLPCQSAFFKVKNYIVALISSEKDSTKEILNLMSKMLSTGFVESLIFSVPLYYYSRDEPTQE